MVFRTRQSVVGYRGCTSRSRRLSGFTVSGLAAGPRPAPDLWVAGSAFLASAGLKTAPYPFHGKEILITCCGRICMHRKKINISAVLAGQKVGIKEVDDGIWLVSFLTYDLGYIDLEQRTLQTLDNPFGTRLLPMSWQQSVTHVSGMDTHESWSG